MEGRKNIVRLICFFVLIFQTWLFSSTCICYYYDNGVNLTKTSAIYYKQAMEKQGIICKIIPFNNKLLLDSNADIVVIVGFGNYYGIFINDNFENTYENVFKWEDVAKLGEKVLIVDSCFSGSVLDFANNKLIITSSNAACPSFNIIADTYGNNVTTMSVLFQCFLNPDYSCPVDTPSDPKRAYLKLLLWEFHRFSYEEVAEQLLNWENPCIGYLNIKY